MVQGAHSQTAYQTAVLSLLYLLVGYLHSKTGCYSLTVSISIQVVNLDELPGIYTRALYRKLDFTIPFMVITNYVHLVSGRI